MAREIYSALMGWIVSLMTTFRTCAEADAAIATKARAIRAGDMVAAIFLNAFDKTFGFFELRDVDMTAWR